VYLKGFLKQRRMAFSFLEYLFSILEIFTFSYYANEESDDIISGSTKIVQHSIENISRILKQCSLNFAPEMHITKETK